MATTATVISVSGTDVVVTWPAGGSGVTSYDVDIYTSSSQPVTTSSTHVGTYSNQTSPAFLSITTTTGNYYAATVTANYNSSISGTAGPTFDPTSVSGLEVWLDAADTTTITKSGSQVTAWANKGSQGSSAVTQTGVVTTGTQNGLNLVRFPASTDLSISFALTQQAHSWFYVAKNTTQMNSGTPYWCVVNQTAGSGQTAAFGPGAYTSGGSTYTMGDGPSGYFAAVTTQSAPEPYNVMRIYSITNSATSSSSNSIYANNTSLSLNISVTASSYRTDNVQYRINTSSYNTGADICEILLYAGEVSVIQGSNIRYYLGLKWGISGIPQPPPPPPYNVTLSSVSASGATVTWSSLNTPLSYTVKIYQDSSSSVTTSSTLLLTQTYATSGSSVSFSGTSGYYVAATVTAVYSGGSYTSIISSSVQIVSPVHIFIGINTYNYGTILNDNTVENSLDGTFTTGCCGAAIYMGGNTTVTGSSGSIYLQFSAGSIPYTGGSISFYTGANQTGSYSIVYPSNNNYITIPAGTQSYYLYINVGGANCTTYGFSLVLTIS